MSGELPAEVQAVIDAALAWDDRGGRSDKWEHPWNQRVHDAVAAYRKATAPPEPFEAIIARSRSGSWQEVIKQTGDMFGYPVPDPEAELWRCTVEPIKRVR